MTRVNFQKLQKLQEILKGTVYNINLPTLVFLGSQSSGKSSVLERLIHCDILPKGYEITTKCPIEINLRNTDNEEYMMLKERKYTFTQGKIAIQKEMDKLCKIDYISQTPIQIDIYSRDFIEISLVDLPGLTKIPLKDQPVDIEKQIYDLTMKYIKNDNCILLPIIPANADISTAEVLKICKEVDKYCKRTLGVITKIDLMDAGTDCLNILTNKIATLEMGYVGVINRGQGELGKKHNLLSVSEKEMLYFKNHEVYSKLWPRIGIKHLEDTLKGCFEALVDRMLPKINSEISQKLQEIEHKIGECTNYLSLDSAIALYGKTVKNVLKEKHIKQDNLFTYESDRNFMHEFKEALFVKNANIKFDKRTIDEIQHSNSIFVSDSLFEKIVNSYFDSYRINTINSFDIVASAIMNHIEAIACHQYPRFAEKAASVLKTCLQSELKNLKKYYDDFMKVHTSCINTSNPDFSKRKILHNVISKYVKSKKDKENSKYFGMFANAHSVIDVNEKFDIDLIYEFTHTYFECNRKIMADHAMKSAYYYLVNNFGKNVLDCLKEHHSAIGNIYKQEIEKFAEASNSLRDEKNTYQKLYDAINKQ